MATTRSSWIIGVTNGLRYSFTVLACQEETCPADSPQTTGTTRMDATPPSGAMQINAGAAATNDRSVTLDLAAIDPLIDGAPGTSSGITQAAVNGDGDGNTPVQPPSGTRAAARSPSAGAARHAVRGGRAQEGRGGVR